MLLFLQHMTTKNKKMWTGIMLLCTQTVLDIPIQSITFQYLHNYIIPRTCTCSLGLYIHLTSVYISRILLGVYKIYSLRITGHALIATTAIHQCTRCVNDCINA